MEHTQAPVSENNSHTSICGARSDIGRCVYENYYFMLGTVMRHFHRGMLQSLDPEINKLKHGSGGDNEYRITAIPIIPTETFFSYVFGVNLFFLLTGMEVLEKLSAIAKERWVRLLCTARTSRLFILFIVIQTNLLDNLLLTAVGQYIMLLFLIVFPTFVIEQMPSNFFTHALEWEHILLL